MRCTRAIVSSRRREIRIDAQKNSRRKTPKTPRSRTTGGCSICRTLAARSSRRSESGQPEQSRRSEQPADRVLSADARTAHREQHEDKQKHTDGAGEQKEARHQLRSGERLLRASYFSTLTTIPRRTWTM